MTIEEIAKAIAAQVKNLDSNVKVTGKVVIDSRKVSKVQFTFIAIIREKIINGFSTTTNNYGVLYFKFLD